MKIETYATEQEWLDARRGAITGTVLKDIAPKVRGGGDKVGFYRLIADNIGIPRGDENRLDRGKTLEVEAIERFEKETGKTIIKDRVIWRRDEDKQIAISPDGYTEDLTEAVEVKCLASERHLEAILTNTIPSEYDYQARQYFVVNDALKVLHFVLYDPSLPCDFYAIDIKREDIAEEIAFLLEHEKATLARVREISNKLTF